MFWAVCFSGWALDRSHLPKIRNHLQRIARNIRHARSWCRVARHQQHKRALVGGATEQFVQKTHRAGRVREDSQSGLMQRHNQKAGCNANRFAGVVVLLCAAICATAVRLRKNRDQPRRNLQTGFSESVASGASAASHSADFTVRPQPLEEHRNPKYYATIQSFEKLTGVGGVLNTTFNLHGDPSVLGPLEALNTLRNSDLDALILGD